MLCNLVGVYIVILYRNILTSLRNEFKKYFKQLKILKDTAFRFTDRQVFRSASSAYFTCLITRKKSTHTHRTPWQSLWRQAEPLSCSFVCLSTHLQKLVKVIDFVHTQLAYQRWHFVIIAHLKTI